MIKLTRTQEITPYKWVHPDEGAVRALSGQVTRCMDFRQTFTGLGRKD
jgi:hypothetical protein